MSTIVTATPPSVPSAIRWGRLLACTLGHAISDGYANFVPPLMHTIRQVFGVSDTTLGLVTLCFSLTTNFGQPVFGYLVDRWRWRGVIPVALLTAAVFMSCVGFAPNLYAFVACLMVAGLGIALFHPRGGALSAEASGTRRALGMSIFGAGGAIGYACASLLAPLLHQWGLALGMRPLQGLILGLPLGLVGVAVLMRLNPQSSVAPVAGERFSLRAHLLPRWRQLAPLFVVMAARSGVVTAFATFFQVLQGDRGASELRQGGVLFAFVAGGALGSIVFGHLSEHLGRRATTVGTLLAAPVFLGLALGSGYALALIFLFLGGLLARGAESVNIAQTQDLLPQGMGTASALAMGTVWGVAGLLPPLVGVISDQTHSLQYALSLTLLLPVIAALVALRLPTHAPR